LKQFGSDRKALTFPEGSFHQSKKVSILKPFWN